ncbi:MAG: GTPase HflX [Candidatus Sumerlaeaceae bacterium]|nr:GTPase HflX [Candidatus Sumerlaeaceae bacterium]
MPRARQRQKGLKPFPEISDSQFRPLSANDSLAVATPSREAYLVCALRLPKDASTGAELSLSELERLVHSASGEVVDAMIVRLRAVDPAFYLTRGKVQQLKACAEAFELTGIVFDKDFSPVQVRNLTDEIGTRIIGRTELILDIFARRAHTHEGKLQVELAQLQYVLPRLIGKGFAMSRLGGGIGTRGPGETKLEMDRRRIADRIAFLKRELAAIRRHRDTQRRQRLRHEVTTVALLGYTNAGKSTLLNVLTTANVPTADQLFATLDPTARRAILPDRRIAVFTDTVGFIHDLPASLIAAFKATLEEVLYADLLVHVVDASSPTLEREIQTTEEILHELNVAEKPILRVYNKIDRGLVGTAAHLLQTATVPSVAISALYRIGIRDLLEEVARLTRPPLVRCELVLPPDGYALLSRLHDQAHVLATEYSDTGIRVDAEIKASRLAEWESYRVMHGEALEPPNAQKK